MTDVTHEIAPSTASASSSSDSSPSLTSLRRRKTFKHCGTQNISVGTGKGDFQELEVTFIRPTVANESSGSDDEAEILSPASEVSSYVQHALVPVVALFEQYKAPIGAALVSIVERVAHFVRRAMITETPNAHGGLPAWNRVAMAVSLCFILAWIIIVPVKVYIAMFLVCTGWALALWAAYEHLSARGLIHFLPAHFTTTLLNSTPTDLILTKKWLSGPDWSELWTLFYMKLTPDEAKRLLHHLPRTFQAIAHTKLLDLLPRSVRDAILPKVIREQRMMRHRMPVSAPASPAVLSAKGLALPLPGSHRTQMRQRSMTPAARLESMEPAVWMKQFEEERKESRPTWSLRDVPEIDVTAADESESSSETTSSNSGPLEGKDAHDEPLIFASDEVFGHVEKIAADDMWQDHDDVNEHKGMADTKLLLWEFADRRVRETVSQMWNSYYVTQLTRIDPIWLQGAAAIGSVTLATHLFSSKRARGWVAAHLEYLLLASSMSTTALASVALLVRHLALGKPLPQTLQTAVGATHAGYIRWKQWSSVKKTLATITAIFGAGATYVLLLQISKRRLLQLLARR